VTTRAQLAHRFNGRATLGGVGFFDRPHGQTGVAPNGIELRPVLGEDVVMSYPSRYKPNGIGDYGGFLVCGENDLWKGRRPYGRRVHFDLDRGHRRAVDLA
jgi:hypothetical protein